MHKTERSISQVRKIYYATTLFLAAIAAYTFIQTQNLTDSSNWLYHSKQVKASLQNVSATIFEAETNKRGFLLSGDSLMLKKRDASLSELKRELTLLNLLINDNPDQVEDFKKLNETINEKIKNLKFTAAESDLIRQNDSVSASILNGVKLMDDVKQQINIMTLRENKLLETRDRKYNSLTLFTPIFSLILFLGALIILVASFWKLNDLIAYVLYLKSESIKHSAEIERKKEIQHIFAQAPVSIKVIRGPDFIIESINETALQMLGKSFDEVINKPFFEVFPGLKEADNSVFNNILKTGVSISKQEFPLPSIVNEKPAIRYLDVVYKPLYDGNENIAGILAIASEVTTQVLARKKIEENEEKLNIVIEASELGIWELGLKSKYVQYSDRYLAILGYKNKVELTHEQILKHLHPDDLEIREKAFQQALKTGVLYYQSRIIWKDKSIHWIEGQGRVVFDDQQIPDRIMGTVRDITEEKKYNQNLQEREQKFRLLADSIPQHVWTADDRGNLVYFNQHVVDYSGLTIDQLINGEWIQIIHPDDRELTINAWINSIKSGKAFLFEHRFRNHKGEYCWQLSRATPQKNEVGEIQMWVGISMDIQNQKDFADELEKQVKDRTNELEEKNLRLEMANNELELFAHISSHDLQEPLRKVQMSVSRIAAKDLETLSDKGKEHFKRVQEATLTMQTLIDDLQAYSRTNNVEGVFELTDLDLILDEVIEGGLAQRIEDKNAVIERTPLGKAYVVPFQFRQLMHNLIGNSLKFSKADVAPHIIIKGDKIEGSQLPNSKLLPEKKYLHLSIADNGIGFDPQYTERIFEVFQRLHGRDHYTGTGIGLAIVKKIVQANKGMITADGELGRGATFDIYFPTN